MQLNQYTGALGICSIITLLITIKARAGSGGTAPLSAAFKRFQLTFLGGASCQPPSAGWCGGPWCGG